MKTFFFPLTIILFTFSCSKNHPESYNYDKQNLTLRGKILVRIKEIKPEIKININREKAAEFGIPMSTLAGELELAERSHQLRTLKAAEQFMIEDRNGKKHRLSEFAEVSFGIIVSYEEPWGANPFNIR
jgi:multidrug efflux pump subunit AcrB